MDRSLKSRGHKKNPPNGQVSACRVNRAQVEIPDHQPAPDVITERLAPMPPRSPNAVEGPITLGRKERISPQPGFIPDYSSILSISNNIFRKLPLNGGMSSFTVFYRFFICTPKYSLVTLSLIPAISPHGTGGYLARISSGIFLAASQMICIARTVAYTVFWSTMNSS